MQGRLQKWGCPKLPSDGPGPTKPTNGSRFLSPKNSTRFWIAMPPAILPSTLWRFSLVLLLWCPVDVVGILATWPPQQVSYHASLLGQKCQGSLIRIGHEQRPLLQQGHLNEKKTLSFVAKRQTLRMVNHGHSLNVTPMIFESFGSLWENSIIFEEASRIKSCGIIEPD